MANQVQVQDYIQQQPKMISIVNNHRWSQFFVKDQYQPIMQMLRKGPMTSSEIFDLYPEGDKKKSETTVYRYIKELIKENLVAKVGRRLRADQTSSKILYGRTSLLFIPSNLNVDAWNSEDAEITASRIGVFLNHNFHNHNPIPKKFLDTVKSITINSTALGKKVIEDLLKETSDNSNQSNDYNKTYQEIEKLSGDESYVLYNLIRFFSWFLTKGNYEQFIEDLKSSFSKESVVDLDLKEDILKDELNTETDLIHIQRENMYFGNWDEWTKYMNDINYGSIISLLREIPLTIKEITDRHHEKAQNMLKKHKCYYEDRDLMVPDSYNKPLKEKKENTIYRYVQELLKAKLVLEVGRRIDPEKPTTQILYATRAKYTIFFETIDEFWKFDSWKNVTAVLGLVLKHYLNKSSINIKKFHDLITETEKAKFNLFKKVFEISEDNALFRSVIYTNHEKLNATLNIIGIIEWVMNEKNIETKYKELLDCFH